MFGFGFGEFWIIVFVIIIFINPKDLPSFFRKVGKIYGEIKALKDGFVRGMNDIDDSLKPDDEGAFGLKVDKDGNFIEENKNDK